MSYIEGMGDIVRFRVAWQESFHEVCKLFLVLVIILKIGVVFAVGCVFCSFSSLFKFLLFVLITLLLIKHEI